MLETGQEHSGTRPSMGKKWYEKERCFKRMEAVEEAGRGRAGKQQSKVWAQRQVDSHTATWVTSLHSYQLVEQGSRPIDARGQEVSQ